MPCPLCLLGFSEAEHTKENWARIGSGGDLSAKLDEILAERRKQREAEEKRRGLPPGSIVG